MPQRKHNEKMEKKEYIPPVWLETVVQMTYREREQSNPREVAFQQQCRAAAMEAYHDALLCQEKQRVGFVPLSFKEYVEGLAKLVGCPLPSLCTRAGTVELGPIHLGNVHEVANLARGLGINLREILAMVRIEMANRLDFTPIPLLLARRRTGTGKSDPLAECEAALQQLEPEYDPASFAELERLEMALRKAYSQEGERLG